MVKGSIKEAWHDKDIDEISLHSSKLIFPPPPPSPHPAKKIPTKVEILFEKEWQKEFFKKVAFFEKCVQIQGRY